MDQHPIPQDVTGFQFKLIGTMTVKQFGYVASGVVSAVILYYLPIHSAFAILAKVILVPLFGASGVIIAFVPLEGRPIDVMATNFVKALFSPNQYIYHRQGKKLSFSAVTISKAPVAKRTDGKAANHIQTPAEHHDEKGEKLRALLLSSHNQTNNAIDKKEAAFLNTLSLPTAPANAATAVPSPASPHILSSFIQKPPPAMKSPFQALPPLHPMAPSPSPKINAPKEPVPAQHAPTPPPINPAHLAVNPPPQQPAGTEHKVTMLSQQINEIHAQKQQLEQELSHLKNQLATHKAAPAPMPTPTQQTPAKPEQPLQDPQHVRTIPQNVTQKVGLPHVSDSPNVVVGIVKDPRGNILPNILVEVKDKENNPVRAFKTNQLGQFASATPLSPGTYTMELDDPKKQHRFDLIQVTANNTVLLPIEIISHDAREELRKQLFAN